MPGLFSSPSDNAAQAASATSTADNAEIANEEQYVNTSEGNLRSAIAGLGPNPYFTPPKAPAPVSPGNTANFFSATPGGAPAPTSGAPAPANMFAAPPQSPQGQPRQAMPVARQAAQ